MMKFFLLPLILFGLVASAASTYTFIHHGGDDGGDAGGRSRPVVLGVGESFELPDGAELEFVELVQDSRCPADAMCIWQGEAVLQLALDGQRFQVAFSSPDDEVRVVDGWAIQVLDVQPYPLASQPHDPADTEVTVRVYRAD
ncbi:MAG: hypothetical protein AB7F65_09050 [Dehalococcoidia bacterium]